MKTSALVRFIQRVYTDQGLKDDFLRDPDQTLEQTGLEPDEKKILKSLSNTLRTSPQLREGKTWW